MQRRTFLAVACAGVAGCAGLHTGPSVEGRWEPVDATLDGAPLPVSAFAGAILVLDRGVYLFGNDRGVYALVAGGPPARMDVDAREGPNAGRHIPTIYRIDGDQLVVCYQLGGGDRPTGFISLPGSKTLLVTYRRG